MATQPSEQLVAYVAAESTTESPASRLIEANEDNTGSLDGPPRARKALEDEVEELLEKIEDRSTKVEVRALVEDGD